MTETTETVQFESARAGRHALRAAVTSVLLALEGRVGLSQEEQTARLAQVVETLQGAVAQAEALQAFVAERDFEASQAAKREAQGESESWDSWEDDEEDGDEE